MQPSSTAVSPTIELTVDKADISTSTASDEKLPPSKKTPESKRPSPASPMASFI